MWTALKNYPSLIPEIWQTQIDKKGMVYIGPDTLEQTDLAALTLFLKSHNCELVKVKIGGAVIRREVI